MKVTIDRTALLKSLGHVQSVVERKGTIPILANIKLEVSDSRIELTATDMDIAVIEFVAANVEESGAVTIPAHTFYDIIRKLPDGCEVSIELKGSSVQIKAGYSKFSLSTLPIDEFPIMSEGEMEYSFILSSSECLALFEKTRFAMSSEETRYYLNGIYFHNMKAEDGGTLRAVATDGHRLAQLDVALPSGATDMNGIIIPRKTITEISKILEDGEGEVKISLSKNKIRFIYVNTTLISKLIDATYPDYERVIPANNTMIMEINTKIFSRAVDRVAIISSDKEKGIKFAIEDGKLSLSANSLEHGTANEELEVSYSGDVINTGFNSRYLLDILTQIEGETVQFIFDNSGAPVIVKDTANKGALYVIMPMRG